MELKLMISTIIGKRILCSNRTFMELKYLIAVEDIKAVQKF